MRKLKLSRRNYLKLPGTTAAAGAGNLVVDGNTPGASQEQPVTVIQAECGSEPHADGLDVRERRQRERVGVSWSSL